MRRRRASCCPGVCIKTGIGTVVSSADALHRGDLAASSVKKICSTQMIKDSIAAHKQTGICRASVRAENITGFE